MLDPATHSTSWRASLGLRYAVSHGRTTLVDRRHDGPLVVQKPLYPDASGRCETMIVHPPGGIAGGDALAIAIDAGARCELLVTTPGATRWYKARPMQPNSLQSVRIVARPGALVEWLPLESIVFDGADARSAIEIDVESGGCVAGWDVVAFGRRAMGERFDRGRFRQSLVIRCDDALQWMELADVKGGDALFASSVGYAGHAVAGMLWVAGGRAFDASQAAEDHIAGPSGDGVIGGITRPSAHVVVARALGNSAEQVKQWLARVWRCWRPHYARGVIAAPRVWAT